MRALFRLGAREAGRHRLRSALVVLLIGLPVAVGVVAVVVWPPLWSVGGAWWWLGDADLELGVPVVGESLDSEALRTAAEATARRVTEAAPGAEPVIDMVVTGWWRTGSGNAVDPVEIRAFDQSSPVGSSLMPLRSGGLADGRGEVVVSQQLATAARLEVGDRLPLALPALELEVVGISADPDDCVECLRAAVAPATFDEALSGTWSQDGRFARVLASAPPDMDQAEFAELMVQLAEGQGFSVSGPAVDLFYTDIDERAWARVWTTVGVVFLLVWTGLIAATGLAVGARRRRRELGLLAANGADPRQLRLAVVAEGLLAGAVGAVGGALVGVGGSLVLLRWLEGVREGPLLNRVDPLGVAVWVAVLIVCGLLAAVLAARAAATGLGRATPNELLRGARRAPRPAPQWFAAGVVAIVAGLVMAGVVANSDGSDGNLLGLMVTVSLGLLTAGLVAMVVGASRVLPRLTAPLPLPARLAGRDLQRHGMRVGASCGAVALTLTAAVASATLFESQRVELDERPRTAIVELPAGTEYLTVEGSRSELVGDQVVDRAYGTEVVADLRAGGFTAGGTRTFGPPDGLRTCWGEPGGDAVQECQPAMVTVLDDTLISGLRPELRRALEQQLPVVAPSLQLRRSDDTPVEHWDLLEVLDPAPGTPGGALMYERAFQSDVLVTEDGARALGVDLDGPELTGSAMVLHDGSDDRIIDRVQDVVGDDLAILSSFSSTDPLPLGWVVAGGMGFVTIVTLLVVLFALALMRVESRADDAVLAVVGASPAVARRTQAMRGGLMVLMAAVPATAVGWALVRVVSDGQVWPVVTPWWAVGIVVVVLPVLTALLSGLSDRPGRRLRLG